LALTAFAGCPTSLRRAGGRQRTPVPSLLTSCRGSDLLAGSPPLLFSQDVACGSVTSVQISSESPVRLAVEIRGRIARQCPGDGRRCCTPSLIALAACPDRNATWRARSGQELPTADSEEVHPPPLVAGLSVLSPTATHARPALSFNSRHPDATSRLRCPFPRAPDRTAR